MSHQAVGRAVLQAASVFPGAGSALAALVLLAGPLAAQDYFQQDVRYTIRAALDEPSGVLAGTGQLVYRNNSPTTLRDLYFHLYLNAFRPHSLWSDDERREGIRRFADLPEPYSAFEQLRRVSVSEAELEVDYPNAPDSTVAHVALRRPLAPGDSVVVSFQWLARASAIPRRQGRRGRRFDFAQWYPKVCVYDRHGWQAHPLRLAGELYGEYGSYDVTLDLAEDQVVAATALPVGGDPGWARASAVPGAPVTLQAGWYGPRLPAAPDWLAGAAPGRKRVRFYAEDIHHFAFSLNPEYRYEEGRFGDVVLRTFYLPQDSATWGGGRVIERTRRAMAWLDSIFGAYPYPQTVVLHRIEGGGTEFPMLVMNGGPEESLIFHEVGHIYTYGILGNNEWKEGWLDEGFTTFQTAWNFQRRGMGVPSTQTQQLILGMDLDAWSEPVSTVSERFREFGIYSRMIYTKGQLIQEMLRYQLGETAFRRGLRLYYDRWKLKHVDEEAYREAMEEASGQDLRTFFRQWLHEVPLVDYRIGDVSREQLDNGSWRTTIEVRRRGTGTMPVDVAVPAGDTVFTVRASGVPREELVQVVTPVRPGTVELDPARQTMDWNYLNNREGFRFLGLGGATGRVERRIGWSSSQPARRDRLVEQWLPLAWYSDAGGVTVGVQSRTSYMGRFQQDAVQAVVATREPRLRDAVNVYYAVRNPVFARAPRLRWGLEGWMHLDGRSGFRLYAIRDLSRHLTFGPRLSAGLEVNAMYVNQVAYLDPGRWTDANIWELAGFFSGRWTEAGRATDLKLSGSAGFSGRSSSQQVIGNVRTYLRGAADLRHRRVAGSFELRGRGYAAGAARLGGKSLPLQRAVFLAGADPYETFNHPFLRSQGALLTRADVNYSAPGGAGLRGYGANTLTDWVVAANVELVTPLLRQPRRRVFSALSLAAFADAGWAGTVSGPGAGPQRALADAGVGLRAGHRIGPTSFVTRVDFPLFASVPGAAVGAAAGDGRTKFRFVWSLEEAF